MCMPSTCPICFVVFHLITIEMPGEDLNLLRSSFCDVFSFFSYGFFLRCVLCDLCSDVSNIVVCLGHISSRVVGTLFLSRTHQLVLKSRKQGGPAVVSLRLIYWPGSTDDLVTFFRMLNICMFWSLKSNVSPKVNPAFERFEVTSLWSLCLCK